MGRGTGATIGSDEKDCAGQNGSRYISTDKEVSTAILSNAPRTGMLILFSPPPFSAYPERTQHVPNDVVTAVEEISTLLEQREYMKANDAYLRLAIGNAPWPMGVTAVGIHERSGREKLFTNRVARMLLSLVTGFNSRLFYGGELYLTLSADIMNDETQRKYIQSIKRIMSFLQKKYPNDPSKNMG